jgi:hypothetical protein
MQKMNMQALLQKTLSTKVPAATILARVMVGGVFFTEGIQM